MMMKTPIGLAMMILCPMTALPLDEIPEEVHWEQVLSMITEILKEIVAENSIKLFNVQHIAVGFVDGDLEIVK